MHKDYLENKLICYVNDERSECYYVPDTITMKRHILVEFTEPSIPGRSGLEVLFFLITSHNTNDITQEGFSYSGIGGLYEWPYELSNPSPALNLYGYTTPFPIFYNTNGGITCPHRGIESGFLHERTTAIYE
jgi:hypothetical protein